MKYARAGLNVDSILLIPPDRNLARYSQAGSCTPLRLCKGTPSIADGLEVSIEPYTSARKPDPECQIQKHNCVGNLD